MRFPLARSGCAQGRVPDGSWSRSRVPRHGGAALLALLLLLNGALPADDVGAGPVAAPAADPAPAKPAGSDDAADPPSPLFDKTGKLNHAAYVRAALDASPAGIDRKFGPDAAALAKAEHKPAHASANVKSTGLDEIFAPPLTFYKDCRNGQGKYWQVGGPPNKDAGDYSSTHGQILYVPDKASDPGVDRISLLDMGNNVFTFLPEPTWWGGWHPEPAMGTRTWLEACGGNLGSPIAIARSNATWCNSGLIIFTSGLIGTAGTCTSGNTFPFLMLPKGKVPTAISVTNKNEFALITVWDVEKFKGQVAVIALEASHTDGLMALYEGHSVNPCMPSTGGYTSMKLLGFIDLPFATPSAICAVGNRLAQWITLKGKNSQPKDVDLSKQEMRDSFLKGENATWSESAGFAVVLSRSENKAAFINLQPLFALVREMYFTTPENYKKTRNSGQDPKQWPYSFEVEPRARPEVVKTVTVHAPTAVNCSLSGGDAAHAYIACVDGKLLIFALGGLGREGPVTAGDIGPIGMVQLARNPVCLAYNKGQGSGGSDAVTSDIIAVCRGDRELDWIHFSRDGGEVVRRLHDKRLVDPMWAECADSHGTESHVISVTDFKGRKVINYRYGPVIFHSNGGKRYDMGPDGKADFECGGAMDFPGFPFSLSGTNVN